MLVCWSMDISCNRLEVLFQFFLWEQFHVTIVWNTRETGDIYTIPYKVGKHQFEKDGVFWIEKSIISFYDLFVTEQWATYNGGYFQDPARLDHFIKKYLYKTAVVRRWVFLIRDPS